MSFLDTLLGIRTWQTSDEVIITDVTRMQDNKVCIAALDGADTMRLNEPAPSEGWLTSMGGLHPGDVVSVSWKAPRKSHRPHVEDRDWNPSSFQKAPRLAEHELVTRLSPGAFGSVRQALGRARFHSEAGNAAFAPGKGSRSLASVKVTWVRAYLYREGVRVDFTDEEDEWKMVPLEDLAVRLHQSRCRSCSSELESALGSEFQGAQALLRVGLGRPFEAAGQPPACWLQVNHVFLIPSKRQHFV